VSDLDLGVDITERINLSVSVSNLFNEKPNLLPDALLAAYQTYSYTNNGPVSAAGRFTSATLRYNW
jgi:outer membrane receptor protein involved in Fe transport